MTAPHTLASLEALSDRELDAVVARIVFGETLPKGFRRRGQEWMKRCESHDYPDSREVYAWTEKWPLSYTLGWQGFGSIIERMQQLQPGWRFCLLGGDTDIEGENFGWKAEWFGNADPHQNYGQRHASARAETPYRAAAIAAILAVQGAA